MRNVLHKDKLQEFEVWLSDNGVQTRPPRGSYQVLQVFWNGGWHAIYERSQTHSGNPVVHLTVPEPIEFMAVLFCKGQSIRHLAEKQLSAYQLGAQVVTGRVQCTNPNQSNAPKCDMVDLSLVDVPGTIVSTPGQNFKVDPNFVDDGVPPWD